MIDMTICYLCLGSNCEPYEKVRFARQALRREFPDIRFSKEEETAPEGLTNPAVFVNQVAVLHTDWEIGRLRKFVKSIETDAGRTPEDKNREIIKLDIDILKYGNTVCKPSDMGRSYVMRGMAELSGKSDRL